MKRNHRVNNATAPPLTPNYPSRTDVLSSSKSEMHSMRNKLGVQQNMITAMKRELKELNCRLRFVESAAKLLPVEQSKSVALKILPRERA
jgi:hypothetical protein